MVCFLVLQTGAWSLQHVSWDWEKGVIYHGLTSVSTWHGSHTIQTMKSSLLQNNTVKEQFNYIFASFFCLYLWIWNASNLKISIVIVLVNHSIPFVFCVSFQLKLAYYFFCWGEIMLFCSWAARLHVMHKSGWSMQVRGLLCTKLSNQAENVFNCYLIFFFLCCLYFSHILPLFQITNHSGFSRYIVYGMHHIGFCLWHALRYKLC